MGDNIGKIVNRILPYNAASLTMLWPHVDPQAQRCIEVVVYLLPKDK